MGEEKKIVVHPLEMDLPELIHTGASYTRTYHVAVYFCCSDGGVSLCPVHLFITKGYANERYVYQIVPRYNYAIVIVDDNEPDTISDIWSSLRVVADGKNAKRFIEAAESGVIKEIWERIRRRVPGRFCYHPPAEFIPTIYAEGITGIDKFLMLVERMRYPRLEPGWFQGGYIKTGKITPTRQGNLVGMSKVSAPVWARAKGRDVIKYVRTIEIAGNEQNTHRITFEREVQVVEWRDVSLVPDVNRSALVFAATPTRFRIEHPQHNTIEGKFVGLIQFVHLRRAE